MIFGLSFYQIASFIAWFFAYSFVGWCWEIVYCLVTERRFVNRGFLHGPVLPIYGVGALLAVVTLNPSWSLPVQFLVACVVAVVLEYGTSWALEKLFHARWWDYSDKPFNLNGRICLPGIVIFGVMMVAVVRVAQPWLAWLVGLADHDILEFAAMVLSVALVVDLTASSIHTSGLIEQLEAVQERLSAAAVSARATVDEVVADVRTAMGEAVSDVRATSGEQREQIEERLDDLARHTGVASYKRKAMRDPFFQPVRASDAFNLMRSRAKSKRVAEARRAGEEQG